MDFMLAERGTVDDLNGLRARGYAFDLKVDGIRALISASSGADPSGVDSSGATCGVTMATRIGSDLTDRFPELVEALAPVASRWPGLVLDAEIAVPDGRGLPSWPLTQQRTAKRSGGARWAAELPARLYVFDLLSLAGQSTTSWPYHRRRLALEELATEWIAPLGLTLSSDDPWPLWDVVTEHRLEGIVAKRRDSRYHRGRSGDWVKVKAVKTLSCLVGGVDWAPQSSRAVGPAQPRALELYLVDTEGELVPVGRVGAAASVSLRHQLLAGLSQPPLIVEVEYTDVTTAGRLRQPVLRRVRADLDVWSCGTDQLADGART